MIKVYFSTKHVKLVTSVTVKGKQVPISFDGGTQRPNFRGGYFKTSNVDIQDALESDPRYGGSFALKDDNGKFIRKEDLPKVVESDIDDIAKETPGPVVNEVPDPDKPLEDKPEIPGSAKLIPASEVKNVTEAKSYLMKNFEGITPAMIANKPKVIETANSKNIVFEAVK